MEPDDRQPAARRGPGWRRRWLPLWLGRRRGLTSDCWVITVVAWLGLLFAYVLPSDLRSTNGVYLAAAWVAFMIRTFVFHLGLVLLLVTVLAVVLRRRWLLVATVPVLLFTLGPALWHYRPKTPPPVAGSTFRVLSANLLASNRQTGPLVEEVRAADADVVVFQEYTSGWDAALRPALAADYPYRATNIREDSFGQAIFSRLPVVGEVDYALPLGSRQVPQCRVVLNAGGRPIALYSVHVFPPKSRAYWIEQRRALADLFHLLRNETTPAVVCGDFNFTNRSRLGWYVVDLGLVDAHDIAGWGRGTTWPNHGVFGYVPGVRIDHVYLSPELTARAAFVGSGHGSDHRPVIADVGFCAGPQGKQVTE